MYIVKFLVVLFKKRVSVSFTNSFTMGDGQDYAVYKKAREEFAMWVYIILLMWLILAILQWAIVLLV